MNDKFKELFDECGIHIDPLNMEVTMKELGFLCEQIVLECAAVCEEHPALSGRDLAQAVLDKFNVAL